MAGEVKALEKEISELKSKIAASQLDSLFNNAETVGSVKVITAVLENTKPDVLRTMGDQIKDKASDAVAVIAATNENGGSIICACGKDAVANGAHAGKIVQKVSALTGGKGGGRPDSAMAGMGDASKAAEAIAAVSGIVAEFVK